MSSDRTPEVQSVAVLGAGTMGAGIAQVAAAAGCRVALLDRDHTFTRKAVDSIAAQFQRLADRGKLTADQASFAAKNLSVAAAPESLADADLIIEAVFEDLAVKHEILRRVEVAAKPSAIFATNTSSLSVRDIAAGLKNPSRLAGMHFFNPAPLMPLVEVIAAENSDPAVVDAIFRAAVAWGKTAVRARDVPGFIVNRVARPYYLEALRLLCEGIADIPQIDAAMKALGFRMGPFELMDLVGIDVNYAVSCSVYDRMGRPERLKPHDIQRLLVESNALGRKTKCGFYDYTADPPRPIETRFADCESAGKSAPELNLRPLAHTPGEKDSVVYIPQRKQPLLEPPRRAEATGRISEPRAEATGSLPETRPQATGSVSEPGAEATRGISEPRGEATGSISEPRANAMGSAREPRAQATGGPTGRVQTQILFAVLNEAAHALHESVATAADIDLAMEKGTNYPIGPITWTNLLGPQNVRQALSKLNHHYPGRFSPAPNLA